MKPNNRIILSGIVAVLIFGLMTTTAKAAFNNDKRAVLIIVDRLSYEDMENLPGFDKLIKAGAVALMNNRPSGAYSACKGYASIGSGARAEGTPSSMEALEVDDDVAEVFFCRTGYRANQGMVVNPCINRLIDQNLNGEYRAIAGNIGYYLHRAGLKTALLGNSDCGDTKIRWAISIAMDRDGIVDYGVVGEGILEEDSRFPTGFRTDYAKLRVLTEQMLQKADFIVIETGDLTRIESNRELLSTEKYNAYRQHTLFRIDGFIEWIKRRMDYEGGFVILATPYPTEKNISRGARLTPVIIYGKGFTSGLLTSGTTRREGIVGGIDIAPTVLGHFGIKGEELTGRLLKPIPAVDSLKRLKELNSQTVNTSNFRYPVLYNYAVFVIFVVLLGLFTVLCPTFLKGMLITPEEVALLFIMVFPFVLLILPIFRLKTLTVTAVTAVAISIGFSVVVHRYIKKIEWLFLVVSGVTTVALVLDIITGNNMLRASVLGYDPIIGARYYGIGNEYMGIVTGSVIIATSSLLERCRLPIGVLTSFLGIVIIVVGCPALGANLGGSITCFSAFAFFMLRVLDIRIGFKQLVTVGIVLVIVLSAFLAIDVLLLEDYSHLAAAAQGATGAGPINFMVILQRKITMNLKLLKFTVWTKVLITVITVTGILFYRPVGIFKGIFAKYPVFTKGWSALVVAAAVGMAVNDSGVVTSATSSIFFIASMLYVVIQEIKT